MATSDDSELSLKGFATRQSPVETIANFKSALHRLIMLYLSNHGKTLPSEMNSLYCLCSKMVKEQITTHKHYVKKAIMVSLSLIF